jgi:hypothetical protein
LQRRGGILSIYGQLSKPIAEALTLIRALNIRYVWVDTLCIVQDQPRAKSIIDSMGLIFANSHLTICAADEEDGQAGLLALDPSRRRFQHTESCSSNIHLMVSHLSETYIRKSIWNSRAWTL